MIPIFLSSDFIYSPYLAVVIKSVCENTNSSINFYILDCGIGNTFKKILTNLVSQYNDTIEFINPAPQNIFNECRAINHISKAAYIRLLIPDLKPDIDKAIYLDVDIVFNTDIAELFNQDLKDYIIGAVYGDSDEYYYYDILTKKTLGIDIKHHYFNSGVLLIDCKKWRENNITQKLNETYDRYNSRMMHHDQDLLNILFSTNNYFHLNIKFNSTANNISETNLNAIYHYIGAVKPWQFSPDLSTELIKNKEIWWYYAKKTDCFELIKDRCIYEDSNSLRMARVKKAHGKIILQKIEKYIKALKDK